MVIIARGAVGILTLMPSTRVEDAGTCRYVNEEVRSTIVLAEAAGVPRPDSLPVEPSSELSVMSSIFNGFHAFGPLFRLVGCAFASALNDTGAALGGNIWSSASRLTCLALAAVAAAYSAALACAPRPDMSLVRRGLSSGSGSACYVEDAVLVNTRSPQMCLPEFWWNLGAWTAWLESKEDLCAEAALGLNPQCLSRDALCSSNWGVRQAHGQDEGFGWSNVVVSFHRGLLEIVNQRISQRLGGSRSRRRWRLLESAASIPNTGETDVFGRGCQRLATKTTQKKLGKGQTEAFGATQ